MSRIRKTNTKPEMVVRRLAHGMGFRFRLHRRHSYIAEAFKTPFQVFVLIHAVRTPD